ncbi:MAG: prefoldin subunit beta [Candidatus Pacearchaeota archaeon]
MNIDKETQEKIHELQSFEQNIQSLLIQKQAFQMELSETENALSEIIKTKDDVYKMIGNIMIKTSKENIKKELEQKKELLLLRLKSIENQEEKISKKADELREEVMKKIN